MACTRKWGNVVCELFSDLTKFWRCARATERALTFCYTCYAFAYVTGFLTRDGCALADGRQARLQARLLQSTERKTGDAASDACIGPVNAS